MLHGNEHCDAILRDACSLRPRCTYRLGILFWILLLVGRLGWSLVSSRRMWSDEETSTLKMLVEQHGRNWTKVTEAGQNIFKTRKPVCPLQDVVWSCKKRMPGLDRDAGVFMHVMVQLLLIYVYTCTMWHHMVWLPKLFGIPIVPFVEQFCCQDVNILKHALDCIAWH